MADLKKDRRDRCDRVFLKNLDSMHVIMPYMMPKRCDNEAVLTEKIDLTALNAYLAAKNEANPDFKYTWFHAITAALAKTILLRPKMNWFISGDRLYARRDICAAFNVKRKFADDGQEAIAKFVLDPDGASPIEQVHSYVRDFVTDVRVHGKVENTTEALDILAKLPRFLLRFVFWVLGRLEYHGRYPKSLQDADPMYSSVYISNLGSIKMSANYHHIYEWGTISFFAAISEKRLEPFFQPDGSYEMRDSLQLALTIDERIADGYYFAGSMKLLRALLQNPELLDLDPKAKVDFN